MTLADSKLKIELSEVMMFNGRSKSLPTKTQKDFKQEEQTILAELTEQIWQDLDGQVSRTQIQQAVMEEAASFHTSVAPALIHRWLRVKLIKGS